MNIRELENAIFSDKPKADRQTDHPGFHLTTPAHMMFDVWGAFYHDDYYHIFFGIGREAGRVCEETTFGHARSKDLLHFEHLPLPIMPTDEELRMNDGCIVLNGEGTPLMLYTSVPLHGKVPRSHCAAKGTADLCHFERVDSNPFMTLDNHGGPRFGWGWSDPFVFKAFGRTFMLMSKCVDEDEKCDRMPIYEATDDTMLHWEYRGIMLEDNGEVVNFFPIGNKWVLIFCPYNTIKYFVGTFDEKTLTFTPENQGFLSYGYVSQERPIDRGFYATCVYLNRPQPVLCGWMSGFDETKYWNGCMATPRVIGINEKSEVTQQPIPELDSLHETCAVNYKGTLEKPLHFALNSSMLDMQIHYSRAQNFSLTLGENLSLRLFPGGFALGERVYDRVFPANKTDCTIRLLVDKCFCEVFFDDGAVAATYPFEYMGESLPLTVQTTSSVAEADITVYTMQSIDTPCNLEL